MCHICNVTLFNFTLQRGMPIIEQVAFVSVRSILRGEYRPGDPFPSVRAIAAELKIHPNTAHKAIQWLIEEGWLVSRAGVGTVVADRQRSRGANARGLLRNDVDRLIVRARSHDISLRDVIDELKEQWSRLDEPGRTEG
jgi:GntR family transcriptional regulator